MAWLGPELDHPDHARAQERAAPWLGRQAAGTVPLLSVVPFGGRTAWLYEPPAGVSVGALLAAMPEGLPLHVAAELCAQVAEILEGIGPEALAHPGPEPDHVLVAPGGRVSIAGFTGPSVRSPTRREPRGRDDDEALVWRVGVLFAEVLTGSPPAPATDRPSHDTAVRRLLIRAMARPGPPFPDRARSWLEALLAWDPGTRPPKSRVAAGLRDLAAHPGPEALAAWASAVVPEVRSRAVGLASLRPPEPPMASGAIPLPVAPPDQTEEKPLPRPPPEFPERDDDTQVSVEPDTRAEDRWTGVSEHGAIPVLVGPPPELARRQPSLPPRLFDTSGTVPLPAQDPASPASPAADQRGLWWVGLALGALAAGLTAWLWLG